MKHEFLKTGMMLTIISIGEGLAMTIKQEVKITRFDDKRDRFVMATKGKRKEFYFPEKVTDLLVFEGYNLPVTVDTDNNGDGVMRGNACFNFVTDKPDELKTFLETKNINPAFRESNKASFLVFAPGAGVDDDGVLMYPDIETHSAVIQEIKNKTLY